MLIVKKWLLYGGPFKLIGAVDPGGGHIYGLRSGSKKKNIPISETKNYDEMMKQTAFLQGDTDSFFSFDKAKVNFCDQCGGKLRDNVHICFECANDVSESVHKDQGTCCTKCNQSLRENALFCDQCGEKVPTKQKCSNCDTLMEEKYRFCRNCGTKNEFYQAQESSSDPESKSKSSSGPESKSKSSSQIKGSDENDDESSKVSVMSYQRKEIRAKLNTLAESISVEFDKDGFPIMPGGTKSSVVSMEQMKKSSIKHGRAASDFTKVGTRKETIPRKLNKLPVLPDGENVQFSLIRPRNFVIDGTKNKMLKKVNDGEYGVITKKYLKNKRTYYNVTIGTGDDAVTVQDVMKIDLDFLDRMRGEDPSSLSSSMVVSFKNHTRHKSAGHINKRGLLSFTSDLPATIQKVMQSGTQLRKNTDGAVSVDSGDGGTGRGTIVEEHTCVRQYLLEKLLGEGSFGLVYQARRTDETDGRRYAVKECKKLTRKGRKLAAKEASLLKLLRHDHVIEYIESFTEDEVFYMIMEIANSGDLMELIEEQKKTGQPWGRSHILDMLIQIASGVGYLHKNKVMHRDLKPANILVHGRRDEISCYSDQPKTVFHLKITDFGLAREMDSSSAYASTQCGTKVYMSKEAHEGRYSFSTDIWSIGCILYELCMFDRPFKKANYGCIFHGDIPQISKTSVNGEDWEDLSNLCSRMLDRNPKSRPTCREILTQFKVAHRYPGCNLGVTVLFSLPIESTEDDGTFRSFSSIESVFTDTEGYAPTHEIEPGDMVELFRFSGTTRGLNGLVCTVLGKHPKIPETWHVKVHAVDHLPTEFKTKYNSEYNKFAEKLVIKDMLAGKIVLAVHERHIFSKMKWKAGARVQFRNPLFGPGIVWGTIVDYFSRKIASEQDKILPECEWCKSKFSLREIPHACAGGKVDYGLLLTQERFPGKDWLCVEFRNNIYWVAVAEVLGVLDHPDDHIFIDEDDEFDDGENQSADATGDNFEGSVFASVSNKFVMVSRDVMRSTTQGMKSAMTSNYGTAQETFGSRVTVTGRDTMGASSWMGKHFAMPMDTSMQLSPPSIASIESTARMRKNFLGMINPNISIFGPFKPSLSWISIISPQFLRSQVVRRIHNNVNNADRKGRSVLYFAAKNGLLGVVYQLLNFPDTDVNIRDESECTALMMAIENGHEQVTRALLAHSKIKVNQRDDFENTALIWAAYYRQEEITKALLAHPSIQVNAQNEYENTALIMAALSGEEEIVKALLAHPSIEVNKPNNNLHSALMVAVIYGYLPVVNALLSHPSIELNEQDVDENTSLMMGVEKRHEEIVKALVAHPKIDVNNQGSGIPYKLRCFESQTCYYYRDTAVYLAAREGYLEIVTAILSNPGIELKQIGFLAVVEEGRTEIIEAIVTHPNFNLEADDLTAALIEAVGAGHEEIVTLLLTQPNINVNKTSEDVMHVGDEKGNQTALMCAVVDGQLAITKALLAHPDVDVNQQNALQDTALILAARASCLAEGSQRFASNLEHVVKALIEHPFTDVNMVDADQNSALIWAAREGNYEIAKALLAHQNIDVNLQNEFQDTNNTALIYAVSGGRDKIVGALLEHPNIDVNKHGHEQDTALIIAILEDHDEIAKTLLTHQGIEVNTQGDIGPHHTSPRNTPLICATEQSNNEMVLALLAHPNIEVNQPDEHLHTVLIKAVRKGQEEIVLALLTHEDINVNQQDIHHNSSLIWAATDGRANISQALLTHPSVHVNMKNKDQNTALILAASNGYEQVVKVLLDHPRIDVNKQGEDQETALISAVSEDHKQVVKALLTHPSIDVNTQDQNEETAFIIAAKEGYEEITKALLMHPSIDVVQNLHFANTFLEFNVQDDTESIKYRRVVKLLQAHAN